MYFFFFSQTCIQQRFYKILIASKYRCTDKHYSFYYGTKKNDVVTTYTNWYENMTTMQQPGYPSIWQGGFKTKQSP